MNRRPDAEALRARAGRLVESGHTEQAEAVLRDLLQQAPEDPFALAQLGVVHARRGELTAAERLLRRAIDRDPFAKSAHNNLGNVQYVTTARAKGVRESRVVYKYAVRNTIQPLIMAFGMQFPDILSGATIVSIVLSLPTLGPLLFNSLTSQDGAMAMIATRDAPAPAATSQEETGAGGLDRPYVVHHEQTLHPETLSEIYTPTDRRIYLQLLVHGDPYRLLGFIPTDLQLVRGRRRQHDLPARGRPVRARPAVAHHHRHARVADGGAAERRRAACSLRLASVGAWGE